MPSRRAAIIASATMIRLKQPVASLSNIIKLTHKILVRLYVSVIMCTALIA
jgi:hypothetical protein